MLNWYQTEENRSWVRRKLREKQPAFAALLARVEGDLRNEASIDHIRSLSRREVDACAS